MDKSGFLFINQIFQIWTEQIWISGMSGFFHFMWKFYIQTCPDLNFGLQILTCAGIIFLISSISLTFLDMIISPDAKYFNIFQNVEETSRFLARVTETKPSITVNLKCYHNERISRQTGFRTRSLYRELLTYTDSKIFTFDSFVDQTIIPVDKAVYAPI